jgi:phosphate starvation-inducible PhoH-like protein
MARKKPEETKTVNDVINEILPTRYRLKCKNHIQKDYANLITNKEIIIAAGPAGVGKSYVGVARAIELLQNKTSPYNRIIISTPTETVGENLGFLPGDMREKMEPFIGSTLDIFDKIIGKKKRLELEEADIIEILPLGFIRGKSIDNTILLMEEAQNMDPSQMKALLTRIGENSKFIISGDLDQSDRFRDVTKTGLYDAMKRHRNIDVIGFIEFDIKDIVRNPLITKILDNYKTDATIVKEPIKKPNPPKSQLITEGGSTKKKRKVTKNRFKAWLRANFKW